MIWRKKKGDDQIDDVKGSTGGLHEITFDSTLFRARGSMGNKQSSVELPPEPPAPDGGGSSAPRPGNGGTLFKFNDSGSYEVLTTAVVPELMNDGDDDAPQWILDVRERLFFFFSFLFFFPF